MVKSPHLEKKTTTEEKKKGSKTKICELNERFVHTHISNKKNKNEQQKMYEGGWCGGGI